MEQSTDKKWEHFEHLADIGVRGFGASVEEAFENAATAMIAVITNPEEIKPLESVDIECDGGDIELLLPDFLNAILFEISTRGMLFGQFKVKIEKDSQKLFSQCRGEKTEVARHAPTVEIKAATYTELKVEQGKDGRWVAQCVVDV